MIWLTSDTHFGHSNIIKFQETRRHFASVDEMDSALIKNWNDRIGGDDVVYHLGDVSMTNSKRTSEILTALNGKIHLIRGNHDRSLKAHHRVRFESVQDYLELKREKGKHIVMCHYPFAVWRDSHRGSWHLHGHSHGSAPVYGKRIDVGVDCFNMAPVALETVEGMMGFRPIRFGDYHGLIVDNQKEAKDK